MEGASANANAPHRVADVPVGRLEEAQHGVAPEVHVVVVNVRHADGTVEDAGNECAEIHRMHRNTHT